MKLHSQIKNYDGGIVATTVEAKDADFRKYLHNALDSFLDSCAGESCSDDVRTDTAWFSLHVNNYVAK